MDEVKLLTFLATCFAMLCRKRNILLVVWMVVVVGRGRGGERRRDFKVVLVACFNELTVMLSRVEEEERFGWMESCMLMLP